MLANAPSTNKTMPTPWANQRKNTPVMVIQMAVIYAKGHQQNIQ